ncbi:hypothetical protein [Jiangella rhizosphaerae]|uniref:DUF3784 domain-containing protein n=1 Tax=Jiangella rhizosphaerae TaxID=2293569 RepID=A0A418KNY6_9ACTN|nr:hypothetical protein [Jiangella rhizosphaerae]RIQ20921.1 hypothetical protein DY240_16330 [Jiangella rhizosphaerae]
MIVTVLLAFVAGFFAGNGLPYFVEGSTGRTVNPGPFGDGAVVNVVSGWFLLVIGALAWHFADVPAHPWPGWSAAALGVLAVGLVHARTWRADVWGRRRPWNATR